MAQNFATALSAAAEKLSSDLNTNFVTLDDKAMKNALNATAQSISEKMPEQKKSFSTQVANERNEAAQHKDHQR